MLRMPALEHWTRSLQKWAGWTWPDRGRPTLPRPWHPDDDQANRQLPSTPVIDSDRIIAHMDRTGNLHIDTGSVDPQAQGGKTGGVWLNVAREGDPQFTISRNMGRTNLCVKTGYGASYGAKVRIPKDAIPQGYPMSNYSDYKLHIYDPIDRTITEIQYCERILPWVPFIGWFFGGGYTCHGVTHYSLDLVSTHPEVRGSSAANIPLAENEVRYDDYIQRWSHMTTCAVPFPAAAPRFVPPAQNSDGSQAGDESSHPDAVQMGMILRLTPEAHGRLSVGAGPQTRFVLDCWLLYGIMVVDRGGNIAFGVEVDPRWDQDDLAHLDQVQLQDFTLWTL